MNPELTPSRSRLALGPLGRFMYDARALSIWDRDTATLPFPYRRLRKRYRAFAREYIAPHALKADADPYSIDVRDLFIKSASRGFQTELLPQPLGTMKFSSLLRSFLLGPVLKAEEFCAACGGLGLSLLAHELGMAPLFVCGDSRAVLRWMWRIYREIKRGEPAIAAFAITEPDAGSDMEETVGAASARLSCRGRKVAGGWRLSGRKCFISDGAVARWVTLFAAPEGRGLESWTCYLLDKSMQGFSVGRTERKMGQRAADASELILEDVFVPDKRVIGPVGAGWAINRNVLNFSRPVVGAIAMGIARGAFEHSVRFCNENRLGNRLLVDFQDVQLALADMMTKLSAMRGLVWQAVRYRFPFQAAGSMAKVFCSDTAWEVCNQAMELLGDHGYLHSQSVEKAARDVRLTQIYEGTNQINRLAIVESQLGAEFKPSYLRETDAP
ncbi:MAG: acyl-CoA/acyl-ACP dehydrogenase [Deltaproteobacteria bacterium]|nr:acyl-CoA/acyl-ACP dehydrogenase [Deltaproteobacteria bacterium]